MDLCCIDCDGKKFKFDDNYLYLWLNTDSKNKDIRQIEFSVPKKEPFSESGTIDLRCNNCEEVIKGKYVDCFFEICSSKICKKCYTSKMGKLRPVAVCGTHLRKFGTYTSEGDKGYSCTGCGKTYSTRELVANCELRYSSQH